MKSVFADAHYWIAIVRPNDHHFEQEGFTVLIRRDEP